MHLSGGNQMSKTITLRLKDKHILNGSAIVTKVDDCSWFRKIR